MTTDRYSLAKLRLGIMRWLFDPVAWKIAQDYAHPARCCSMATPFKQCPASTSNQPLHDYFETVSHIYASAGGLR